MTYDIFDIPVTELNCSLNEIGRPKYGSLEDLLLKDFKNCQVGTPNGYQILPNIRLGEFRNSRIIFDNPEEINLIITSKIIETLPYEFENDIDFDISCRYKVLRYKENDFFNKHQDKMRKGRHYGTLLIFPPAIDEFQHTGGELILNDIYTFESGSNKVWKAVFFTGDTFHEVKKIISGQRIVFKTELFFKVNHNLGYNIFPEEIYEGHTD